MHAGYYVFKKYTWFNSNTVVLLTLVSVMFVIDACDRSSTGNSDERVSLFSQNSE